MSHLYSAPDNYRPLLIIKRVFATTLGGVMLFVAFGMLLILGNVWRADKFIN